MGLSSGFGTSQKNEPGGGGGSGPPFALNSANDGLSVDPVSFKIVLGTKYGNSTLPARLVDSRQIDENGNTIYFTGGSTLFGTTNLIGSPPIQFKTLMIAEQALIDFVPQLNTDQFNIRFRSSQLNDNLNFYFSKGQVGVNEITTMGYNLGPSANPVIAGVNAMGLSFEGNYVPGIGQLLQEFHLLQVNTAGVQRRPLSVTMNTITNTADAYFSVSSFEIKDDNASGRTWFQMNGGDGGDSVNSIWLAGPTNNYSTTFTANFAGGNTTATFSTTGPGAREFHIDSAGGWSSFFGPGFFQVPTYFQFSTQVLPFNNGTQNLGDTNNRWDTFSTVTGRANVLYVGDYSANQFPAEPVDIFSARDQEYGVFRSTLRLTNTDTTNFGGATIDFNAGGIANPVSLYLSNNFAGGGLGDFFIIQHNNNAIRFYTNNTPQMVLKATGTLNLITTGTFATNALALAGGLVTGDVYKDATGLMRIVL